MSVLHEILAVEKSRVAQSTALMDDATRKFSKSEYFSGHTKALSMINDDPENDAIQAAAYDEKQLPTTVSETLKYVFQHWNVAEDVIYQKNRTNQTAKADIEFRGQVIVRDVPIDELMGLEHRLVDVRKMLALVPTLSASVAWSKDPAGRDGAWVTDKPEVTTKTEKVASAIVLYEATDKHPAQIEKVSKDVVVGSFTKRTISGAATSLQKAESLKVVDDLLVAVKQARMRANTLEIVKGDIGQVLTDLILAPFTQ